MLSSLPFPKEPLVSIVITSYNRANLISEAIESALSQTYPLIEVIISDNCSTDNTLDVLEQFKGDHRVKIYRNESNLGVIENFRKCIFVHAKGHLITFISSDDFWLDKNFVSEAVQRFTHNPSLVIAKGRNYYLQYPSESLRDDIAYLYWKDSYYGSPSIPGRQVLLDYPQCPSVGFGGSIYKKDLFCKVGFGDSGDDCLYADAETTLKLLSFGDVTFIDKPTYVNRLHGANSTGHMTVDKVIKNEIYIMSVFNFLRDSKYLEESCLNSWKDKMLRRYYTGQLKYFRTQKSDAYSKISNYLSEAHESAWLMIKKSINWKIFSLIAKSPFLVSIWAKLGRLKVKYKW